MRFKLFPYNLLIIAVSACKEKVVHVERDAQVSAAAHNRLGFGYGFLDSYNGYRSR